MANNDYIDELLPHVKRFINISGKAHTKRRVAWVKYTNNYWVGGFLDGSRPLSIGCIFCDDSGQHIYSVEENYLSKEKARTVGFNFGRHTHSYSHVMAIMKPLKKEGEEKPIALLRAPTKGEKDGKWTDKKSKKADYKNKEWTSVSAS